MITISLCMIVKDEELTLERCLNCAKDLVDEIIIVDTGSKDKTVEIAKKFTDKVYYFEWIQDFAAARNYSFSKATKEYILWLDADDIISEESQKKFKTLKNILNNSTDSVTMLYNLGINEDGVPALSYRRNRLVKRLNNFRWYGRVHDYILVGGNIINSDVAITHKKIKVNEPNRNLNIYKKMIEENHEFNAREVFYYGNELYDHKMFDKAITQYTKLLDMDSAWYEDKISACNKLVEYYTSIKKPLEALKYCFRSFLYDKPRAEFAFKIGNYFHDKNNLEIAIFWYQLTTTLKKPVNGWGFYNDAYWTWLPHVQLCVCYDKQGKKDLAFKHNEKALSYSPNNKILLQNKKYYENLGFKSKF
ncbi:glycosyltransferase family 2 protein [Clostridium oceanicum]|uniref:Glycosyltransferase n=1 Tax=Clostridium oceanicum TaxID=1543 RepID=A0ABP3UJF5_9CLOT